MLEGIYYIETKLCLGLAYLTSIPKSVQFVYQSNKAPTLTDWGVLLIDAVHVDTLCSRVSTVGARCRSLVHGLIRYRCRQWRKAALFTFCGGRLA